MHKPVLLVVDDEPFNLEIICEYLEEVDCEIDTAVDGDEAWQKLQSNPGRYDLVVLDRMMPRMDGMQVLANIKADPMLKTLPVIMQTAAAAKEQVLEGLRLGAYYYLTKPFESDVLLTVIRTALADRMSQLAIIQQMEEQKAMLDLLADGTFHVRSLPEARRLAAALANICPNSSVVALGLAELLINAIEHGNLGIGYEEKTQLMASGRWAQEVDRRLAQPDNRDKRVVVRFTRYPEKIMLSISDEGPGFDWQKYTELDPARAFDSHGRGIALAKQLSFQSLEYLGRGNEVIATLMLDTPSVP